MADYCDFLFPLEVKLKLNHTLHISKCAPHVTVLDRHFSCRERWYMTCTTVFVTNCSVLLSFFIISKWTTSKTKEEWLIELCSAVVWPQTPSPFRSDKWGFVTYCSSKLYAMWVWIWDVYRMSDSIKEEKENKKEILYGGAFPLNNPENNVDMYELKYFHWSR